MQKQNSLKLEKENEKKLLKMETVDIPKAGENLPMNSRTTVDLEYKSQEKETAVTTRRFGFCIEFECCDGRCCCFI